MSITLNKFSERQANVEKDVLTVQKPFSAPAP